MTHEEGATCDMQQVSHKPQVVHHRKMGKRYAHKQTASAQKVVTEAPQLKVCMVAYAAIATACMMDARVRAVYMHR